MEATLLLLSKQFTLWEIRKKQDRVLRRALKLKRSPLIWKEERIVEMYQYLFFKMIAIQFFSNTNITFYDNHELYMFFNKKSMYYIYVSAIIKVTMNKGEN